ncbi:MAG: glycoside hydrolase family 28 protein [Bacteroidaceae bacterium]|nr:glycoside hydrolase family 28 protein [Bacteroidaceae bacterium]MBR1520416.1 glycoside hydrolase family 28 protein [Bacteroidaceae bacterium]
MKKSVWLLVGLWMVGVAVSAQPWEKVYPKVVKSIKAPKMTGRRVLNIADCGARTDASAEVNQRAINEAIRRCHEEGGGKVVVPAGVWQTGALTLKSRVNLVVERDATLQFVFEPRLYPQVLTHWEGLECYNISPLIYARDEVDIAITGEGTIDGGGTNETWWTWTGVERFGWQEGMYSQRQSRQQLQRWSEEQADVEQRRFDQTNPMRPQTVNFMHCRRVLIEGVTLLRSPFWVLHPVMCEDVTVRGVTIVNAGPNGDGCDPESCNRVLIENCRFRTGDDCIAIKSGRNADGRRWGVPCRNVVVRNCRMEDGHGGIVVGSEISGGFRNLFVEDCQMDSPNLDRVVRIKTNTCRGGVVENIYVRNVEVGECREAVLKINLNYEPREQAQRGFIPTVRNVQLDNVNCHRSKYGAYIVGLEESEQVQDIAVRNCRWSGVTSGGNRIEGKTRNVVFEGVRIEGSE